MLKFLVFLFPLPLFLFLIQIYRRNRTKLFHLPPGPPGLPLIGNLHQLDNLALYHQLSQLSKTYGSLMSLQLGFTPALVVSSAEMAKEVLKTQDAEFASRPFLVGYQKMSYNGLDLAFAPYNDYWREMRKICVLHLFSTKRVQSFHSIRREEVSLMIKKISKQASDSQVTNLSEMLLFLTNTLISRIAFGKSYDDEICIRSKFHNLLIEIQGVVVDSYVSDYFPCMSWVDKLTGKSSRLEKTFKELDAFLQEIINEHLDDDGAEPGEDGQEDIIHVLLRLHKDSSFTFKLTSDHIKAILMDIFTAGSETSSITLVWVMTELVKNPNAMKRVQEEVRNMAGKKDFIDESDLEKLPYMKSIVKETLRLHPPGPLLIPHETTKKCNISGYQIHPKTRVYVNAWAIGRDPRYWEDSEKFMPERFLGNSIDFRGKDFEYIPFGSGRRGCPGLHMGVVNVELAIANLLYMFNWKLPDGMNKEDIDMDMKPGLTMHKKIPLILVARNNYGPIYE